MVQVQVQEASAQRLQELATMYGISVDMVLDWLLAHSDRLLEDEEIPTASQKGMAFRLLEAVDDMNFSSGVTDTSEKSREILENEYVQ